MSLWTSIQGRNQFPRYFSHLTTCDCLCTIDHGYQQPAQTCPRLTAN
jgi:hypothetical protein